jgi:hypothetical protein
MFSPKKSLEHIVGELKGKSSTGPTNEPNLNSIDKHVLRKIRKGKKQ